jgi:hypothetical protein
MGKMKNLMIDEEFEQSEDLFEGAHYWMLVDNVANWCVDNKSTTILDDIANRIRDLYIKGDWVSKRKKGV